VDLCGEDLPEPLYKNVYDNEHSAALEVRLDSSDSYSPLVSYYVQYRPTGSLYCYIDLLMALIIGQ
jgi:hypothetical protein